MRTGLSATMGIPGAFFFQYLLQGKNAVGVMDLRPTSYTGSGEGQIKD